LDTKAIPTILGALTSFNIARDLSSGDVELWYRAGTNLGFREATASAQHTKALLNQNAMMVWDSLSASPDESSISSRMLPVTDGVNDLIQILNNQANIPAIACDDVFVLGPVRINGTLVDGVTSLQIQNNVTLDTKIYSGDRAPCYIGVKRVEPVITIQTDNAEEFGAFPEGGINLDGVLGLEMFLRKTQKQDFFVPDGSTEHIRIRHLNGIAMASDLSGDTASTTIEVHLEKTSTGFYLIDTASAIV